MGDSIVRSATKLIRSGRLGGQGSQAAAAAPQVAKAIDPAKSEVRDWQTLVGDGSVRRLTLSVADVNQAFEKSGNAAAAAHPEEGDSGRHLHRPLCRATSRCRPSAAVCSATTATTGWPAG